SVSSANFTHNCMKCICEVEGCEHNVGKCNPDSGSLSCGPYQIKSPYYQDCYSPGSGWQACTKGMSCSETCVKNYMRRYGKYCTGSRTPTCKDYAMIHNGGPKGCTYNLTHYWGKVQRCCNRRGGC
ncbi:hypothetical protein CAPTEDRAFT_104941, partial [Capitella teleta]